VTDLRERLLRDGVNAEVIDLGVPMPTAPIAAEKLGVPIGRIFKSLVVTDGTVVAVVVLPGDKRVDLKAAARALGVKNVKLASPEVVLHETGYPAGGTPPLGHAKPLPVLLDQSLFEHPEGYGGGGAHELLVKIAPDELKRATNGVVVRVTQGT
jgi:Cys-tRNA(Pro)/Cys-tRNA(Cys) deacylase